MTEEEQKEEWVWLVRGPRPSSAVVAPEWRVEELARLSKAAAPHLWSSARLAFSSALKANAADWKQWAPRQRAFFIYSSLAAGESLPVEAVAWLGVLLDGLLATGPKTVRPSAESLDLAEALGLPPTPKPSEEAAALEDAKNGIRNQAVQKHIDAMLLAITPDHLARGSGKGKRGAPSKASQYVELARVVYEAAQRGYPLSISPGRGKKRARLRLLRIGQTRRLRKSRHR